MSSAAAAPPPKLSEQILDYPGVAPVDEDHFVLSTLNVLFLPAYVRDDENEEEFLRECYCPPGAYSQLSLLNRSVLRARYSTALGQELRVGLEEARTKEGLNQGLLDEVAVTSAGRDPIVILGDVGVGKTMFLRRLLRVDAKDLADDAVQLYVDLGRDAVLDKDLREYTVASFREQLFERYDVDIDAAEFLRGTYHGEARRFAKGLHGELRETDETEFKRREIDHLADLAKRPEEHLRRSLEHLVKLRRQQVIVVLDNIDQRDQHDQEQVFLIAESMSKTWPCTVFVTLRPETFDESRIRGTLTGYQPRAFTIGPPRVERVVVERLKFGARHYRTEGRLPQWLGWTADSEDLRAYLGILLKSFSRNEKLQTALINLSGGNARRALELTREFVQSPHAEPSMVLDRNSGPNDYLVPHHLFLRSVLLRDAKHYHPTRSGIPNLFDVSSPSVSEHFLLPCVLGLLRREAERRDSEGYIQMNEIFAEFQELGFTPDQVDFALRRASDGDWTDPLPPSGRPTALRLTNIGAFAHQTLACDFQYVDVVIVDTPVADAAIRGELHDVHAIRPRLDRAELFIGYLDTCWKGSALADAGYFDWVSCSSALGCEIAKIRDRL